MSKFHRRLFASVAFAAAVIAPAIAQAEGPGADGIVRVRSAYSMDETISRIRADIAAKGILFFQAVDQSQLAAKAGITLRPSTLLEFGNPPLGVQFLTANANAGLDWPVRLLVSQDESGAVWATWTDFAWIAKRHGITNRQEQFAMASKVVESITSTVRAQ
ncbi:MAG: DUF302 domain-containing protein [Burkholderiales bacterium]|nr:DUF302 domain-containing protein [Burkholderiales bacterium]